MGISYFSTLRLKNDGDRRVFVEKKALGKKAKGGWAKNHGGEKRGMLVAGVEKKGRLERGTKAGVLNAFGTRWVDGSRLKEANIIRETRRVTESFDQNKREKSSAWRNSKKLSSVGNQGDDMRGLRQARKQPNH